MKKTMLSLMMVALLSGLGGCSMLGQVNAWEKGKLAKPGMAFDGDPLDLRFVQHIYASKENSSGVPGVARPGRAGMPRARTGRS